MSEHEVGAIARTMAGAARAVLAEDWPEAKKFVESESLKFARSVADIGRWVAEGEISPEDATFLLGLHVQSMKMVLIASKGIGLVMAERAVNAALGAVRDAVNGIVGFAIL